mmetsp:Transcript_24796/g.74550  ORF Transcript_24796/g.74550 Transcript_24796/m.74550 type:complete len:113 (-) Transcript_24796:376-714(-)
MSISSTGDEDLTCPAASWGSFGTSDFCLGVCSTCVDFQLCRDDRTTLDSEPEIKKYFVAITEGAARLESGCAMALTVCLRPADNLKGSVYLVTMCHNGHYEHTAGIGTVQIR